MGRRERGGRGEGDKEENSSAALQALQGTVHPSAADVCISGPDSQTYQRDLEADHLLRPTLHPGAEELQQAAERKQAEAAIPGLQQAAATFKEAIALSQEAAPALPPDRQWDAFFGLVSLVFLQLSCPLCLWITVAGMLT